VGPFLPRNKLLAFGAAAALCGALIVALLAVPRAGADPADLEAKLAGAREEAGAIAADLQESNAQLATVQAEADDAAAREEKVTALLAEGRERAAHLSRRLRATRAELVAAKARLRRARQALAARLVAIYRNGTPSAESLILGASSYESLMTQVSYLREIAQADSSLAHRVADVRDEVRREAERVAVLEARAIAHEERLAAAREEIASLRQAAEESAAHLSQVSARRQASLASLKTDISTWVEEIQEAREAEARAASQAEAEEEVGRWLGGPYSIPAYIVMCESGGNYGALNPSSGAGGAYQILPSTWDLYGGQGDPHTAPKAEQDRIAAEIWADSGGGAWVCA
jgi:septal ring factor EnvC (AmiA/AmiB activator)